MGAWRLKLNGVVYTTYRQLRFTKERNKLGYIEFVMFAAKSADYSSNISYDKKITLEEWDGAAYNEIFKGYIRTVEKVTFNKSKVTGYSPGIILFDRTWSVRQPYTNTATNTILTAIASGIITVGTNTITNVITTRFELDNKLRSVAKIANVNNGEWWEDEDGLGADRINLATSRYSSSSVETLTLGQNCSVTEDKTDSEKIFNCITVIGRGDGINQVKTVTYGYCLYQPSTTAAMTSSVTSVTITDSTGMASTNGIVYINNEKILYGNRTGLNLYNLTRGYSSTTAVQHSSGMRVWYAGTTGTEFTKASPATGSSVDTYGIREYAYFDKRIVMDIADPVVAANPLDPNEAAGVIASRLQDRFDTPVRTITIKKRRPYLGNLGVGKTITVTDNNTGLNADFKIYSIEMFNDRAGGSRGVNIVVNNLMYNFTTDIDELKKDMDTTGMYEQGATNIYAIDSADNCAVGFPLNMRFFMAEEAKAINKVLMNFKIKPFRAYSSSDETEYNDANTAIAAADKSNNVTSVSTKNWTNLDSITTSSTDCDGVSLSAGIVLESNSDSFESTKIYYIRFKDASGNYYPSSRGVIFGGYNHWSEHDNMSGNLSVYIPGNLKSTTFTLQVSVLAGVDTHTRVWANNINYVQHSRHKHTVDFGIIEESLSSPSVNVAVNGTAVGTYTSDQTKLDLTSYVEDVGIGQWIEVTFTPNKNMRIEANAYVQIYLESKL